MCGWVLIKSDLLVGGGGEKNIIAQYWKQPHKNFVTLQNTISEKARKRLLLLVNNDIDASREDCQKCTLYYQMHLQIALVKFGRYH